MAAISLKLATVVTTIVMLIVPSDVRLGTLSDVTVLMLYYVKGLAIRNSYQ